MPFEDNVSGVDLTSDLGGGDQSQQGTPPANTGGEPQGQQPGADQQAADENRSVRELLEQASGLKQDASGRLRTDDGKFAAKPPEGTQAGTEQTQGTEQQGQPQASGTEQVQLIPEYQQIVSALPEANRQAVQAALVARETAVANYVQEVQARVSGYAAIEQVIAPRREAWAMTGTTPEVAITQLFALSDYATRDPRGFLEWFAGNNNIDLSELGETFVPPDPQMVALQNQVQQLTGVINSMQNGASQSQHSQFVSVVQQFEVAADDKGQPKYPHFKAVSEDMLALVPAIRQQNPALAPFQVLEQAYDRAVYANPQTRALMLQANNAQTAAAEAERVRRAAAASQSLSGTAPSHDNGTFSQVENANSVRGALEAAFAAHS